jgi:Sugar-transfer associated ATP-grasp
MGIALIQRALGTLQTRWWEFFHKRCLAGFPWFWPARSPGVPAMVAARRMARRQFGRNHHPVYRALAQVLAAIAWPPAVLINLCRTLYFREPEEAPIKQVPGALWAAMRHNIEPGEYYAYALWQPNRKVNIDNYLYSKEGLRLFKVLNRPTQPNPVDDKLAFYEMCKAHALPCPEILAVFTPTKKLMEFECGCAPLRDLFVKPRVGAASDGAEHFRWQGVVFESERGCRLKPEDLGGYLATRASTENRTLLVQPALSNHPGLGVGGHTYLATARLVTGLPADGNVIPIFGSFTYFTRASGQTVGRRVALIDVASGRLTWAPRELAGVKRWIPQLDNGSDDTLMLPDWDTVLRHTKVAHQACRNFVFVGWDAVFTELGPMLLEGNLNWTAADYQRLRGEPLGYTKFADILASRLTS